MMKKSYGLIKDGVLVQKQPYKESGFVEIPNDAVCGQIQKGKKFVNGAEPERTPEQRRQREFLKEEIHGNLPNGVQHNIDEIWKVLAHLEEQGVKLTPRGSEIIKIRKTIKDQIPKDK